MRKVALQFALLRINDAKSEINVPITERRIKFDNTIVFAVTLSRIAVVLSTAMDKANAVTVWIMDVHFAVAPGLIGRFQIDDDALCLQFLMEFIHILNSNKNHAARYSITRKRGNVQLNIVTRQTHVARIRLFVVKSISELPGETQMFAIELLRCGRSAHVQDRNG